NLAKTNKLNTMEKPGQMMLLFDPFSQDNDLLTPTMKIKRNVATKFYKNDIDRLYKLPKLTPKK
uniref:hypothetical protein n=1 Tax=Serratia quinivorans TaxID=137545 RepID=UPI0035C72806